METHSIVILFLAGCLAAVTTAQRKERVAPSAPRYFEVNQHRTGLRMQWEAPTAYHVDTYFIEYRSPEEEERRGITGEHWRAVTSVPGTETSYMWHGALSKHNYYLRVTAVNNDVHGDTSSVIHVEFTQKGKRMESGYPIKH
ncbi:hypothetical protein CAPTEDRAFT_202943 [Capitella teleta]|uniref:Fibronectin type-III domain-containing protein n=1 Tax=Capitella teleta TaxID=283909 RepID=R7U6Z2_CAPTE|nr:hypothetical protein CAPTEDRAFT_202943 [Capitella teleta]|eukprot:ELT99431.1 hypothetical protein CAPTEDRAFT_202943 [Capitella teleta]